MSKIKCPLCGEDASLRNVKYGLYRYCIECTTKTFFVIMSKKAMEKLADKTDSERKELHQKARMINYPNSPNSVVEVMVFKLIKETNDVDYK